MPIKVIPRHTHTRNHKSVGVKVSPRAHETDMCLDWAQMYLPAAEGVQHRLLPRPSKSRTLKHLENNT